MKMSKADKMLFDLGYKTTEPYQGGLEMVKDRFESITIENGYNGEVYICKIECKEATSFTLEEFIAVNEKLKEEGYLE